LFTRLLNICFGYGVRRIRREMGTGFASGKGVGMSRGSLALQNDAIKL